MLDSREVDALLLDLGKLPGLATKAVMDIIDEAGDDLAADWATNARETSGEHGRHYPDSITASPSLSPFRIGVVVGPETGRKQGGMGKGFEYGSRNQPPHMDGNRAADILEPKLEARIATTLAYVVERSL